MPGTVPLYLVAGVCNLLVNVISGLNIALCGQYY